MIIKLAYIQSSPVLNDPEQNIKHSDLLLNQAETADIVVLPELANSGYNFIDREEARQTAENINDGAFCRFLSQKAKANNQIIISGVNEQEGNKLYNSAVLFDREGRLQGHYRKLHLFMNEKQIFDPGDLGLPVFEVEGIKIGIQICFDWTFPESWRILALKGAMIIAHPANLVLPYSQQVTPAYAVTNRMYIITANRVGKEREMTFTGNSIITDPDGQIVAKADSQNTCIREIDADINKTQKNITTKNHIFEDRRTDVYELNEKT